MIGVKVGATELQVTFVVKITVVLCWCLHLCYIASLNIVHNHFKLILVHGRFIILIQVNTDVLDTVLLSLHPAEVNNYMWFPTKTNLLKVVAANDEVSLEDQS